MAPEPTRIMRKSDIAMEAHQSGQTMSSETPSARQLARRLVERAVHPGGASKDTALVLQVACDRTYHELTRSLGPTGSRTLLARAIAQAQGAHPILNEIRVGLEPEAGLGGLPGIVEAHGSATVTAAIEAMLEKLFGLLGRLIGDDMVERLVERSSPNGTRNAEEVR